MGTTMLRKKILRALLALLFLFLLPVSSSLAGNKNLLESWSEIKMPPPVTVESVHLDPKSSALLILDIEEYTCNADRRPRCLESLPQIQNFLERARSKGLPVIYSLTLKGTPQTILTQVQPLSDSPVVQSGVDKFYKTDLEKILLDRGIKTVVIVGTAAEGAVLHTATGAALRDLKVVAPLDGMSSATPYAEQYTAWHMLNAPGTKGKATLTLFNMIDF